MWIWWTQGWRVWSGFSCLSIVSSGRALCERDNDSSCCIKSGEFLPSETTVSFSRNIVLLGVMYFSCMDHTNQWTIEWCDPVMKTPLAVCRVCYESGRWGGGGEGKEFALPRHFSKGVVESSSWCTQPSESLISSQLSVTHVDHTALYKTVLQLLWSVGRDQHPVRINEIARHKICILLLRLILAKRHLVEFILRRPILFVLKWQHSLLLLYHYK
jgi:hypothetical protein